MIEMNNHCTKRKFKDKIAALFALSQCRARNKKGNRQEKRIYYCDMCHTWHLTSKSYK